MTITEAMSKFRLTNPTTPEDLKRKFRCVIEYGDKVLVTWSCYRGEEKPSYCGAVYEYLDDEQTEESAVGMSAVSDVEFFDAGHALEWAMKQ